MRWQPGSRTTLSERSVILEQPLDVIEFDLRPRRIGETAAQLFKNAADPLHIDLAGNLDARIIAELPAMQRPPQRVGLIVAALPARPTARTVLSLSITLALLHG